ncbi:hypothetical protein BKA67DRAFT_538560 [Truncatella angustata]|uniref:Uncharacterized protein n=1 Tax=Truncatella angustata TaxID=152316 RepID=A0A9P8ZTE8_9PEZI|nr:uncharacterized protein BKA67DRAFT_538560 [Truncatella angustata]KAH6648531.1 hypothetical protein BKA67DRAFT_538560 [Truncatella angustata]KAH8196803.1 hypothetical protein TruAng_009045 [Truncatella angustata]
MSGYSTIEDFNLQRKPFLYSSPSEYILQFPSKNYKWKAFEIVTKGSWNEENLHAYDVSRSARMYVVKTAYLADEEDYTHRHTSMRLHQMILANYAAAGIEPRAFRYLGFNDITNEAARLSLLSEFQRQGMGSLDGQVTVKPTDPTWEQIWVENPFVKCGVHLLDELRRITRESFVIQKVVLFSKESRMDMMIEFGVKQ